MATPDPMPLALVALDALAGRMPVETVIFADEAEILTVGVVPSARRRGIARMLLGALLDEARRRGAREAYLEVRIDNAAARALYAKEGFAELGIRPGYYDAGRVDAVVMSRDL